MKYELDNLEAETGSNLASSSAGAVDVLRVVTDPVMVPLTASQSQRDVDE